MRQAFFVETPMANAHAILLILIWVGIVTYCDALFKSAASMASTKFIVAASLYFGMSFLAFWTFKLKQFGWVILLWNSVSLAASLVLSVVAFREPFTIRRCAAAVLVLAAILVAE
jgi:hypothetical protein